MECQLKTSKSGLSSDQNWKFVDRGREVVQILDFFWGRNKWATPTKFFFAIKFDYFVFLSLSSLSAPSQLFSLFCMLSKKEKHN